MKKDLEPNFTPLFSEIIRLIEESRNRTYSQINVNLTLMYWQIGKHISLFILDNGRADYGKQILPTLSV